MEGISAANDGQKGAWSPALLFWVAQFKMVGDPRMRNWTDLSASERPCVFEIDRVANARVFHFVFSK